MSKKYLHVIIHPKVENKSKFNKDFTKNYNQDSDEYLQVDSILPRMK